jgi:hypoxanthine phosphoribosyltransferase
MNKHTITPFISTEEIAIKNRDLAEKIDKFYRGKVSEENPLVLLVILKGSVLFFSDLVRLLQVPVKVEFISISSYGHDMESSGQVRFELDVRESICGKHVLIVEDIIDTGRSLSTVLRQLDARGPASLEIVTLLSKPERRVVEVPVRFVGFTIPDKFVIGYGMDYAEHYRELDHIGVLSIDNS